MVSNADHIWYCRRNGLNLVKECIPLCVCVYVHASMGENGGRGEEGRSVHVCDISIGIGSGFFSRNVV